MNDPKDSQSTDFKNKNEYDPEKFDDEEEVETCFLSQSDSFYLNRFFNSVNRILTDAEIMNCHLTEIRKIQTKILSSPNVDESS